MTRGMMKGNAREALRGNWGIAILSLLIGSVLITAATCVVGIGELIIIGPIETGLALIFMKLRDRENPEIGDLFVPFQNFVNTFFAGFLVTIFTFLWSLLLVVPGIVKSMAYSQTFYIMNEHPECTGKEAIDASRRMMDGHKWEFFVLNLSFIGWFLLCGITFGLAMFYVMPYYQATTAEYYRYLKEEQMPRMEEGPAI